MHGSTSAEASGRVDHLVDRHPTVSPERLIAQLRPPPTFAEVSFATYRPDPAEPTQAAAVGACQDFCRQAVERPAGRRKLLGKRVVLPGVGLYLDGGFGVGKTHLLASASYQLPGDGPDAPSCPKAFAKFGELTQLAGVFGFVECIDPLAHYTAVCIDEFELDDPGNTADLADALATGRAGRVGGRHLEHAARAARRGPFRRPGFSARDQYAGKDFHHSADRGTGLSASRPAAGAAAIVGPGSGRARGGCPGGDA
jgi:AFG1-like ATPase